MRHMLLLATGHQVCCRPCRRECGYVNRFTQHECATCGAVRWDGAGGQLRARLAAVLQTADLSSTSMRQVLAHPKSVETARTTNKARRL